MIFKDLIAILKKVKTENDITENVAAELTAAAVFAQINSFIHEHGTNPEEAFEMTRSMILKHLDMILLDMMMNPLGLEEPDDDDMTSPMDDPILNEAIHKAMLEYNDRLDKKNPPPNMRKV